MENVKRLKKRKKNTLNFVKKVIIENNVWKKKFKTFSSIKKSIVVASPIFLFSLIFPIFPFSLRAFRNCAVFERIFITLFYILVWSSSLAI